MASDVVSGCGRKGRGVKGENNLFTFGFVKFHMPTKHISTRLMDIWALGSCERSWLEVDIETH